MYGLTHLHLEGIKYLTPLNLYHQIMQFLKRVRSSNRSNFKSDISQANIALLSSYCRMCSGLTIKILSTEPNCIFKIYLQVLMLYIETSTYLGSLHKFEGAA